MSNADHIRGLEIKVKVLKREIRHLRDVVADRNQSLKATNLIVKCTGCDCSDLTCADATEEDIEAVEKIATRLRTWWNNCKWRQAHKGVD